MRRRTDGHGAVVDGDDARPGRSPDDAQPPVESRFRRADFSPSRAAALAAAVDLCPNGSRPAIEKLLEQERPWFVRVLWLVGRCVRRLTLVSGAIWLLTLPLVMARFHIFNPIAVLINTAVWLPMAGALVSGLALLLCSMIPGPLAAVCAVCLQLAARRRRVAGAVRRARALRT